MGSNVLAEQPAEPVWRKLLAHLAHPMALLLWTAGGLAIGIGDPTLGAVIWTVVLVNGAASFTREYRASQAIAFLKQLLPGYARVIRENSEHESTGQRSSCPAISWCWLRGITFRQTRG